jgi:hypothetical protein
MWVTPVSAAVAASGAKPTAAARRRAFGVKAGLLKGGRFVFKA